MMTSGAADFSVPAIAARMLTASAGVRFTCAMTIASERPRTHSSSHNFSSLDTCRTGGPNGCRKLSALLRHRPGLPPRVTSAIARWRFWRRTWLRFPAAAVLGAASARPISTSLPSGPRWPRTPSPSVKPPSNSGNPSTLRSPTAIVAVTGSIRFTEKISRSGGNLASRTWAISQSPEMRSTSVAVRALLPAWRCGMSTWSGGGRWTAAARWSLQGIDRPREAFASGDRPPLKVSEALWIQFGPVHHSSLTDSLPIRPASRSNFCAKRRSDALGRQQARQSLLGRPVPNPALPGVHQRVTGGRSTGQRQNAV